MLDYAQAWIYLGNYLRVDLCPVGSRTNSAEETYEGDNFTKGFQQQGKHVPVDGRLGWKTQRQVRKIFIVMSLSSASARLWHEGVS